MLVPDIGFVYPKTGLDVDLRFEDRPRFTSTGSVYLADETDDCVDCDGVAWTSGGSWSISFWFKSISTSMNDNEVFWGAFDTDGSERYSFYFTRTDTYGLSFFEEGSAGGGNTLLDLSNGSSASDTRLIDGNWHHLALVMSNSGLTATVYIDGQSWATGAMNAAPDMSGADNFSIGGDYNEGTCFGGNMTQFGMWNAALTQAQVRAVMGATDYASAVTASGTTALFYWSLETDADADTGGVDGTLKSGAAMVGDRARVPNGFDLTDNRLDAQLFSARGVTFDGTGDQLTSAGPNITTSGAWSVSCWVKSTDTSTQYLLDGTATSNRVLLYLNYSGNVSHWATDDVSPTTICSSATLLDGMWHHLVITVSSGTAATGYIDGKSAGTATITSKDLSSITTLEISGASTNSINGSLSDFKIISGTTLSAAQVLEQYQNPELLLSSGVTAGHRVAHWPLSDFDISGADNIGGLYLQDIAGSNPLLATNCGMEFSQPGIPQMGLRSSSSRILFDEVDDIVTVAANAAIDGLFGAGGSISLWVMPFSDGEGTYGRLVETASGGFFLLCAFEDGAACDLYFSQHWDGDDGVWVTTAPDLTYGEWNHIVLTYDASSTGNDPIIYINNSVKAITESTTPTGTVNADNANKTIGNDAAGNRTFDGIISEVAMYKGTILDADAVTVMYNSGIQGFDLLTDSGNYDNAADVDGWWKLDNAKTITDLSTNSNTGAVTGNPNIVTIPEGTTAGLTTMGTVDNKRPWNGMSGLSVYQPQYNVLVGNTATLPHIALGTNLWTISLWFKIRKNATVDNGVIYDFYDGNKGIKVYLQDADQFKIYLRGASGIPTTVDETLTDAQMYDTWVHLCVRRELAATFSFVYHPLDLTAVTISDSTGTDAGSMTPDNGIPFVLSGSSPVSNQRGTSSGAAIADVRIWDAEAISDAQVDALYESGARFLRST